MKRPAVDPAIDALWNEPLEETEFARRLRLALAELDGEEYENLISLIFRIKLGNRSIRTSRTPLGDFT